MADMMKAAVFEKPKQVKIKQVPVPEISAERGAHQGEVHRHLRHRLEHLQRLVLGRQAAHDPRARVLRCDRQDRQELTRPEGRRPRHRRHQHELRHLLLLHARAAASVRSVHATGHPHRRHLRRVRQSAHRQPSQAAGQPQLRGRRLHRAGLVRDPCSQGHESGAGKQRGHHRLRTRRAARAPWPSSRPARR